MRGRRRRKAPSRSPSVTVGATYTPTVWPTAVPKFRNPASSAYTTSSFFGPSRDVRTTPGMKSIISTTPSMIVAPLPAALTAPEGRKGRAAEAPAGSGPGRHGRPPGPAGGPAAPAGPAAGPGAVPGRGPGGGSGPGRRGGRGDAGPRVRGAEPAAGRAEGQLPGDAPGGRGGVRREPHRGAAAGVPPRAERPRAGLGRGAAGPVPRGPGDPAARGGNGVWGGGPTPRRAAGRRPGLRRHRPAGERPGRAAGGGGPLGARVLLRMRALRGGVLEGLPRVHAEEGERRPGPAGRRRRARHHVRRRHGGVRPGVLRREADDRGRGGRASSGRRAPS